MMVYGPNGFFREFSGNEQDPLFDIHCVYEKAKNNPGKFSGNIMLQVTNGTGHSVSLEITDRAYQSGKRNMTIPPNKRGDVSGTLVLDLHKTYGWYDFSVKIKGNDHFQRRYAGHVETGDPAKTDPGMGQVI